jgi:hypothetical protein
MTKTASSTCALLAALLTSLPQTGCKTASSAPAASWQIYQPRILRLPAGVPVTTTEGTYTPTADEDWHPAAALEKAEAAARNAAAALAQRQKSSE